MRMIDRWFPCAEVSEASHQPHGSGRVEKGLFTWFAARPVAQARAAVLTTLLPWPDDLREQERLKVLVRNAVGGDILSLREAAAEIQRLSPKGVRVLDPFAGRAIIPLEAARAGAEAWGVEYSPVATLAGMLLADFPARDWRAEPAVQFRSQAQVNELFAPEIGEKLTHDVQSVLTEIGDRLEQSMDEFFPRNAKGERPWGYFWAQTMPCDECKNQFPLIGSTKLRNAKGTDRGAHFSLIGDRATGELEVILHDEEGNSPTFVAPTGKRGKVARCPFCQHTHTLDTVKAKSTAEPFRDRLLIVADLDPSVGRVFRLPTEADLRGALRAEEALSQEKASTRGKAFIPDEAIPSGNNDTVRASIYGVRFYADMCCPRQTLSFARLCRIIAEMGHELEGMGCSSDYVRALLGYSGAVVVRKLGRSTRGAVLQVPEKAVGRIFLNQASLSYGFDFFESGIGQGPGTWRSLIVDTTLALRKITRAQQPTPARIRNGSALHLPFRPSSVTAVITDPPYYNMIDYSDASDMFFVWLKRALRDFFPELFDTSGVQDKQEEIIVKRGGAINEHRTTDFYRSSLNTAFENMHTVLMDDGALTLVFGHGDPKAWSLLLSALHESGFTITGSWPARTEESGGADSANIVVTITIACRPAPASRPNGLQATVDLEVERAIRSRIPDWERDNLALTDQLMASYGPCMEVLGKYQQVMRPDGVPVEIEHYLSLARRTVQDAAAIKIDGLPLETFDARTRFALFWARLYSRQLAPKSEAAFQAMASNLRLDDVRRGMLEESTKGYRLEEFGDARSVEDFGDINSDSAVIDVVRQMVRSWRAAGGQGVASVLALTERDPEDLYLWAVIGDLANILPAADRDRKALEDIMRNRRAITTTRAGLERQTAVSTLAESQTTMAFAEPDTN